MRNAIEDQHQAAIVYTYSWIALTECCCGSTACAIWAQALIQFQESDIAASAARHELVGAPWPARIVGQKRIDICLHARLACLQQPSDQVISGCCFIWRLQMADATDVRGYLVVTVAEASGRNKDEQDVWDSNFLEGYVKGANMLPTSSIRSFAEVPRDMHPHCTL